MKSILFVGIIAALGLAMTTAGLGINNATAQMMADNATMAGNMTGGNITSSNTTQGTSGENMTDAGQISDYSGEGDPGPEGAKCDSSAEGEPGC
jgi:hypothetical protein